MRIRSGRGFTIAEFIVSAVITLLIIGVAVGFYVIARDAWQHVLIQGNMQNEAILAVEKMFYGVDVLRKGIQEAQDVVTPAAGASSNQIEFIDQDNTLISRIFYQVGDRLVYNNENDIDSDLIDGDVASVTFTRPIDNDDLIQINLIMQRIVRGKAISVNISTSVRLRNI